MAKNLTVVGCFLTALISAVVASGTVAPVAFGLSEQTTPVTATGIVSTITALLGGAGGLFALFRNGTISDFARGTLANIQQGDAHGVGVDAAFIAIVTALILKKKSISTELMSQIADVRNKVQAELDAK